MEELRLYPSSPVSEQSDRVHPSLRKGTGDVRESGAYSTIIIIEKNRSTGSHLGGQLNQVLSEDTGAVTV